MLTIHLLFIGTTELILIGAVVLLLFGGRKLPELMKGLGQGVQSFKKGMKEPLDESTDEKTKSQETETTRDKSVAKDAEAK